MPEDFSKLKSTLANSKLQRENNALFQTILGTIRAAEENRINFDSLIAALQNQVNGLHVPFIVEGDTSTIAVAYELSEYVIVSRRLVIFKDISGNASVNNITLTGTVDGVVNPTISTNYGVFRVFLGNDELYHEW